MTERVIPTNGMVLTEDTQFAVGVYHLPDGIRIGADGISITGDNTTLISDVQEKVGIQLDGHQHVSIRDVTIQGYYHGIRVERGRGIRLENITVRGTHEIEGVETFLHLWLPLADSYGGAILCHEVRESQIIDCDLQHQMHGILLYDCAAMTVSQNNASFNSGWGVYLSNTSDSLIEDNRLDFCNRVFRRESGITRAEADAAGIVMVKGSSRNRILRNSCLCGGDGIFLCGYEHPGVLTPCNDNLFEDNDCRLSPNNAIESTFSEGNIFRRNDCSQSNYGFWMGYSSHNTLEENIVTANRMVGIAIEHGFGFTIRNNKIQNNSEGIRLFTRGGGVLPYFPDHTVCHDMTIVGNELSGNKVGVRIYTGNEIQDGQCHDMRMEGNTIADNRVGAQFNRASAVAVMGNTFSHNLITAIEHANQDEIAISNNHYDNNGIDHHVLTDG